MTAAEIMHFRKEDGEIVGFKRCTTLDRASVAAVMAQPGAWTELPYCLYTLYRVRSADSLLYVGMTRDLRIRLREHARKADWWDQAVRFDLELQGSKHEGNRAERRAIATEQPIHNIMRPSRQRLASSRRPSPIRALITAEIGEDPVAYCQRRRVERPISVSWHQLAAEIKARVTDPRGRLEGLDVTLHRWTITEEDDFG